MKALRNRQIYLPICLLCSIFIIGCGSSNNSNINGDNGGGDNGNDAEPTSIQVGEWSGTVEFGRVNFTVSPEGTSLQEYTVAFQNYTCGITTRNGSITTSWESGLPIDNRKINFEITLSYDDSSYIVLEGTFNDAGDSVSGEFSLYDGSDVCNGTWSASPSGDNGGGDIDDDSDGYTENEGDCNDSDPSVNPGATDIPNDGIDQDCSGSDEEEGSEITCCSCTCMYCRATVRGNYLNSCAVECMDACISNPHCGSYIASSICD